MPIENVVRQRAQAVFSSVNSHRVLVYGLFSIFAVCAAIANALRNYSNFYSVAIFLSKSSRSVLILANFTILLALVCGHIIQRIFFGALRPNEVERLYDRLWFFITESLLAFTIFRDDFDVSFALMFGFLLFVKSFHWLASDRVEWMDQRPYPGPPLLFHIRMVTLFSILWLTDLVMFLVAVESTLNYGVGGMVLFASEYAILMASISNTVWKYLLTFYELRRAGRRGGENAPPWENKSMWVFYIELVTDFFKLSTYLIFFTIIITFCGLPLNIIRDVYLTARSFITRLRALHRYQTATRNMDERYPNATEQELVAMSDRTCIICREEMTLSPPTEGQPAVAGPNTTPKKLPCGHVFHFHCLRSWLERQQSCPTCRRTVFENVPPQGQPNAAGGVVPGAAPQPGNPQLNIPGLRNPNNGGGNGGFLNRFFGPPPPGGGANMAQQNLGGGNAGGQANGVVIQYHIHYGGGRPNPPPPPPQGLAPIVPQNPPIVPPALQPAPQFNGFQGPAGEWQAWPVNNPNDAPTPTLPTQNPGLTPTTVSPAPTPTIPVTDVPLQNPRDAAALAAERRLAGEATRTSGTQNASQTNPSAGSPISTPPSPDAPGQRDDIPQLIPLYDYSALGFPVPPSIVPPSSQPGMSRTASNRGSSVPPRPTPRNNQGQQPRSTHLNRLPINQLPPNLSEEQLAVMDRLSRAAIDERLRVLEGVAGAVNRCIDELVRVRSVLPVPMPEQRPHPMQPRSPMTPGSAFTAAALAAGAPLSLNQPPTTRSATQSPPNVTSPDANVPRESSSSGSDGTPSVSSLSGSLSDDD